SRSSARPGPTYQSALPCNLVTVFLVVPTKTSEAAFNPKSSLARGALSAALDSDGRRYILRRPQTYAKPVHARTFRPRWDRHRRAPCPVRMAASAVLSIRRDDDGGADLARRDCTLARGIRDRRPRLGRALRAHPALVRDRLLECDHRLSDHALCPRSSGGGPAGLRSRARRRGNHRIDPNPSVHPQRAARTRRSDARADASGPPPARP